MNTRESALWTRNPLILLKTAGIALLPALPAFADLQTWGGENTHWWDDLSWDGGQFEDNVPDGDIVHIKNPSGAAPSSSTDNSFIGGPGAAILTDPTIDQLPAFPNGITWKPGTMEKPLGVFGRENDPTEDYWFYRIASMEISNGGEFLNWATREQSFSFCNRMLGYVHPVTWGVPYSADSALSSQGVNIGVSNAGYAKTMGNWFINGQLQIGHSAPGRLLQTGGHIFVAEQMRVRLNSEFDQRGGSILANRGIQVDTTSVLESSGLLTAHSFDPGLTAALSSGPDTILRLTNGSSNFEGKVVLSGDLTAHTHQMESTLDITMGSISEQTLSQGSLSFTDTSLESTSGSIVLLARSIGAGNSDFTAAGAINISPYYDGGEGVLNGCEFTSSSFTSSANTRITESEITASTVTAGGEVSDTVIHAGNMTAGTLTTKDGSRVAATGGFSVGGTWNLEGAGTTATGVSAGIGGATWQRTLNITGGARMTLSGWSNVAKGGTLAVAGGGSRLDAPYLTMGGTQETPANVRVTGGGSVTLIGNLTTGNAYQTQSGITVSGTSRLDCAEARFNSLQDSGTSLDLYAGGTLRAPGGVFLNHGDFSENTATITMGAYFPLNDLFMDPGFIDAPFLEKSPGTGMATLRFRHRQQDALFTPGLRGVDIVESTGPGRTVLRGRMTNTAVLRADAGTLEINHGGAPNTVTAGIQVRGGNLVVNGADLLVDPAGFSATTMSSGTLSVTGGGYLRTALVMSGTNGATPVATVSGLGSELLVQKPFMQVGDAGRARLTIADLGVVTCDPSTTTVLRVGGSSAGDGTVEVKEWSELRANHISVGYQGHGNLNIHSGGKVLGHGGSPSAIVHVGDQAESTGFVSMDGESVLKTNELRIGNFGTGTLEMLSGTVEVTGVPISAWGGTEGVVFGPGGKFEMDIGDWAGTPPGNYSDQVRAGSFTYTATAAEPFVIKISGPTANFQETAKSFIIARRYSIGVMPDPVNLMVDDADFPGTGTWSLRNGPGFLVLDYTPGTETPFQEWARENGLPAGENGAGDDADKDGMNNLGEFALDRDPDGGGGAVKQDVRTMTAGGFPCVYLTIPVRSGAVFGGSPALVSGPADGVTYRIEAGTDLAGWNLPVTEVTGGGQYSIHALMPPLSNANWTYRTFRTVPGADLEGQFIRCRVEAGSTLSQHH